MSLFRELKDTKALTAREADIRDFVLAHPELVAGLSSRSLAAITYTSAATVTRFCKKLGFTGYPEFKLQFTSEIKAGRTVDKNGETRLSARENVVSLFEKVMNKTRDALSATGEAVSLTQLLRIKQLLQCTTYIDVYAYDNNVSLAGYACNLFAHAGKAACAYCESNEQVLHALSTPSDHIAILLSHTGESLRLVELAKILGRRHIKRIIITPSAESTLGRMADEYLFAPSGSGSSSMWLSTYSTGVKFLCDMLFAIMFSDGYTQNMELNRIYEEHGSDTFWNLSANPWSEVRSEEG